MEIFKSLKDYEQLRETSLIGLGDPEREYLKKLIDELFENYSELFDESFIEEFEWHNRYIKKEITTNPLTFVLPSLRRIFNQVFIDKTSFSKNVMGHDVAIITLRLKFDLEHFLHYMRRMVIECLLILEDSELKSIDREAEMLRMIVNEYFDRLKKEVEEMTKEDYDQFIRDQKIKTLLN